MSERNSETQVPVNITKSIIQLALGDLYSMLQSYLTALRHLGR